MEELMKLIREKERIIDNKELINKNNEMLIDEKYNIEKEKINIEHKKLQLEKEELNNEKKKIIFENKKIQDKQYTYDELKHKINTNIQGSKIEINGIKMNHITLLNNTLEDMSFDMIKKSTNLNIMSGNILGNGFTYTEKGNYSIQRVSSDKSLINVVLLLQYKKKEKDFHNIKIIMKESIISLTDLLTKF